MKGPFATAFSTNSVTGNKSSFSRLLVSAIVIAGTFGLQGCFEQNAKSSSGSLITDHVQTPNSNSSDGQTDKRKASKDIHISLHPLSQSVYMAKSITMNTSASAKGVLKYQWLKDGKTIPNAVRSSFTISSATAADEGAYSVRITAGKSSILTRTASLTVARDTAARLSWDTPSKRADGSLLSASEIASYRILHMTEEDKSFDQNFEVAGYRQSYEISNLTAGTHIFAIVTIDVNGMESATSEFVTKRIM